ncbi:MAG: glycoside hydrolase N-terminal domain-containing protein [Lachnospiraceae bacterium]|nr:glycoside hydrolase N-terminal domain-containing protein [Lachnospiraceae bacterium]
MSKLFYKQSANWDWDKALPVGNGKLGAMIFGHTDMEKIQLNEDSLWSGGPMNRINQDAYPNLEKVRNFILDGDIPEAEDLLLHAFSGNPFSQRVFQPFGELFIKFNDITGELDDYTRELDLENAKVKVEREFGGRTLIEEVICSAPENVLAVHLYMKDGSSFNCEVECARMSFFDSAFHDENNSYYTGSMQNDSYRFAGGITAHAASGSIELLGEYIVCRDVTDLTVFFTGATTYRETDPLTYTRDVLNKVRDISFNIIRNAHELDYRSLFGKTELHLDYDTELDKIPTDERLERFSEKNPDNGLIKTYFDFGRYLLISCSRPGSLPANLQGIWNWNLDPAWGCKYTVNINTQMNYWPAEMFGLSDCELPLFNHMLKMQPQGQKTAREMYGCRGMVCHHNTDLWGDTAPQDRWIPGTYWVMSYPWLCTHIMRYFRYTKDLQFLKEMYPVIKDSVLFFHDFLMNIDGKTIICPSVSPENTYIMENGVKGSVCASSTMDSEILRDHFNDFIEAYALVGDDDEEFLDKTKELLKGIPEIKVGKYGQIMEWMVDYDEAEPGHRHISQLYGLHPSHQIDVRRTPELAEAAKNTIKRRLSYGGGHTGWSRAWIMNMFARLCDKEKCYENLVALLKKSTLTNLFDNHPPFQIDGNFGSIAAIGEMILQADGDDVYLLPSLPKELGDGSIRGIYVPGKSFFNLSWKNGELTEFTVNTNAALYKAKVHYSDKVMDILIKNGESAHFDIG